MQPHKYKERNYDLDIGIGDRQGHTYGKFAR